MGLSKLAKDPSKSDLGFQGLVGHFDILSALKAGGRNTAYPSLVFSGPSGVGKRLCGLWYAAFLNCLAAQASSPCGICSCCQKIARGNHPDVSISSVPLDKTVIGVGEVREQISQLGYAPFEGRYRVLIVERADKLTDEAQNALLKSLEEPPARAVIILVTSLLGALIPTVVSRCRIIRFGLLSEKLVLEKLCSLGAEDAQALSLARRSRGSLGLAIMLYQEPKELERRKQVISLYLGLYGISLYRASLAAQQMEKLFVGRLEDLLFLGRDCYRDLLMLACGCDDLVVYEDHLEEMKEVVARRSPANIYHCLELFAEADLHRFVNVNPKILLQRLCLGLASKRENNS